MKIVSEEDEFKIRAAHLTGKQAPDTKLGQLQGRRGLVNVHKCQEQRVRQRPQHTGLAGLGEGWISR